MEMEVNLLPITRCSVILSGCLYSYVDTWGASGSFEIVRGRDDESLTKYRPWCSELPNLPPTQNENSIHFFLLYMNTYTSPSSCIDIHT